MNDTKLREEFYQSFDASRITSLLSTLASIPEADRRRHPDFLGEGTHFQSFSLRGQPMTIAVNIAKSSFMKRGKQQVGRWRNAISELRLLETGDLVPPLEVVEYQGLVAIIMPKGNPVGRDSAGDRELIEKLLETSKSLGKMGLVLDDYPQLVEYRGRYFINDWSDLKTAQ